MTTALNRIARNGISIFHGRRLDFVWFTAAQLKHAIARIGNRLEQTDEDTTDIIMFLCRRHRIQTIVLDRFSLLIAVPGAYENTGAATTKGCLLDETSRTSGKGFREIRSATLG
jgi:hypothetical protein